MASTPKKKTPAPKKAADKAPKSRGAVKPLQPPMKGTPAKPTGGKAARKPA